MILPSPLAISAGSSFCVTRIAPRALVSYMRRHASGSRSAMRSTPSEPPALFTSTRQTGTDSANSATDRASVTSSRTARPPLLLRQGFESVHSACGDNHVESVGSQTARGSPPNPATGTSHNCYGFCHAHRSRLTRPVWRHQTGRAFLRRWSATGRGARDLTTAEAAPAAAAGSIQTLFQSCEPACFAPIRHPSLPTTHQSQPDGIQSVQGEIWTVSRSAAKGSWRHLG